MCININLSAPFHDIMQDFHPSLKENKEEAQKNLSISLGDLIKNSMDEAKQELSSQLHITEKQKNKLVVSELREKGIFDVKGAIDLVAQEIGVSRYTIYNYIREAKNKMRQI